MELISNQIEVLDKQELMDHLGQAAADRQVMIMTYLARGKWQIARVGLVAASSHALILETLSKDRIILGSLQINQPVGMSYQVDFTKYIFETSVMGIESVVNAGRPGKIILKLPGKIDLLHRRGYQRQEVPESLTVKVLFWHRGYLDQVKAAPVEHYWQGKLMDLSAGGMRLMMSLEMKDCFSIGQLVGLQFTPMSFQKPVLLEGHIRYLRENPDESHLYIGIEFLGLEASPEGRDLLQRLLDVVSEYQAINLGLNE